MDKKSVIWNYQREIIKIYKNEGLDSLSGIELTYRLNGKNILQWFHDVVRENGIKCAKGSAYHDLLSDLFMCSDEMLYFTANLYLYRPYINNPLAEASIFYGKELFPNNQNLESKRYSMFADIVGQKTYNYWDRIGDLIASFFPDKFKSSSIYFSNSMNFIPDEIKNSPNYIWLDDFRNHEYKELNQRRKLIVHYITTSSEYSQAHLASVNDREAMERLQVARENLPDYYKNHIDLSKIGFEKTLNLLEELNTILF